MKPWSTLNGLKSGRTNRTTSFCMAGISAWSMASPICQSSQVSAPSQRWHPQRYIKGPQRLPPLSTYNYFSFLAPFQHSSELAFWKRATLQICYLFIDDTERHMRKVQISLIVRTELYVLQIFYVRKYALKARLWQIMLNLRFQTTRFAYLQGDTCT